MTRRYRKRQKAAKRRGATPASGRRLLFPFGFRGASVPDRVAQAILAGIRDERAGGRHGAGCLHGRPGTGLGRCRSLRWSYHPPGAGVRRARGRDCPVGAGRTTAAARGQGALRVGARRPAAAAGRGHHRPTGLLPARGVRRARHPHGLHGRDGGRGGSAGIRCGLHSAAFPARGIAARQTHDRIPCPARLDAAAHARLGRHRLSLRSALDPDAGPRHGWQHLRVRHHAGGVSHRNCPGRRSGRQGRRAPRTGCGRLRVRAVGHWRALGRRLRLDGPADSRRADDPGDGAFRRGGDVAGDDFHRRHPAAGGKSAGTGRERGHGQHGASLRLEYRGRHHRRDPRGLRDHSGPGIRGIDPACRGRQFLPGAVGGRLRRQAQAHPRGHCVRRHRGGACDLQSGSAPGGVCNPRFRRGLPKPAERTLLRRRALLHRDAAGLGQSLLPALPTAYAMSIRWRTRASISSSTTRATP